MPDHGVVRVAVRGFFDVVRGVERGAEGLVDDDAAAVAEADGVEVVEDGGGGFAGDVGFEDVAGRFEGRAAQVGEVGEAGVVAQGVADGVGEVRRHVETQVHEHGVIVSAPLMSKASVG